MEKEIAEHAGRGVSPLDSVLAKGIEIGFAAADVEAEERQRELQAGLAQAVEMANDNAAEIVRLKDLADDLDDRAETAEERVRVYEEALKKITGCRVVAEGDCVDVARQALGAS